jgi:hypothetical protein
VFGCWGCAFGLSIRVGGVEWGERVLFCELERWATVWLVKEWLVRSDRLQISQSDTMDDMCQTDPQHPPITQSQSCLRFLPNKRCNFVYCAG